ncbi:peptidase [Kineobactrum sediminis]|uniref:Peptidase n=1 Tax=Kineobactrum sediminis TaxID=1905677 RepID=A0A2N5Y1B9_9GAMM|nr:PepSY-associated TM helix domain-containing protein [Kineobactrum sediminis]PLW82183.1 peptidase [Kineobactrum sediminis]
MRTLMLKLHRYLGLTTALFLVITGLTGAVISWDHELDEWLNPHLFEARTPGVPQPTVSLAEQVEAKFPQVDVSYFELHDEPGHAQYFWVEPKVDPETGRLYEPGFNQVYVDPVSGDIQGTREWGAVWPITRETFMSFLYTLHFSLHIPEIGGIDHWGIWLLGIIALLWTFDNFIGFYLTLPRRKARDKRAGWFERWKPAWKINRAAGPNRFTFDLHRAVGLWIWMLLFVIAFTAFSLNLYREVFFPAMSLVSDVTPSPLDERTPSGHDNPIEPVLAFTDIARIAAAESRELGWSEPLGSLWYAREFGLYRAEFFTAADGHGTGGVGHKALYFDGIDGKYLGDFIPWQGTAADIFVQAQFPLHSGRILGLPGRILISVMGVIVAMLSITGVIIWWRKTSARERRRTQQQQPAGTGQREPASSAKRTGFRRPASGV